MKNILVAIFCSIFAQAAFAISEHNYNQEMESTVHPFLAQEGIVRSFIGSDKHTIVFHTYNKQGPRGALVIAPGRTESYFKWAEVIFDLAQEGYGPIYTIDHRGQGMSGRLTSHAQKGHVNKFKHYVEDFKTLMQSFVLPETRGQELFLIAHSMGGTISGLYIQKNPKVFKAVAMITPMFEMNLGEYKPLEAEALLNFYCLTGKCQEYAPGKTDFDDLKVYTPTDDDTNSEIRWGFYQDFMMQKPELKIGGPTNGWVLQSLRATRQLRKNAKSLTTPLLIFGGGYDLTVVPEALAEVCDKASQCELTMFEDGKHQLQNEIDPIRDQLLGDIITFFSSH